MDRKQPHEKMADELLSLTEKWLGENHSVEEVIALLSLSAAQMATVLEEREPWKVSSDTLNAPGGMDALMDEMTFISYRTNRNNSPSTTPEQWAEVYGKHAILLEARYQAEKMV